MGGVLMGGSVILSACGDTTPTIAVSTSKSNKKPLIGFVMGVKTDPFYITMERGLRAKAVELGADVLVDGPSKFDATLQTPIVDSMIANHVDVLVIAATDSQTMIAPLQRANAAGIKVISVDTYIGDGNYTNGSVTFPLTYIGSDNVQGGNIAGVALIKSMGGKGKIYIQNTTPGTSTTDQREQGCKQAIEATNGSVTLIGIDYNNNNTDKATQQTLTLLQRSPDVSGIFGANLFSAVGAGQAVRSSGRKDIKIAGFDAAENSIKDLRDGIVDLLVAQKPADMGSVAVDYAMQAMQGNLASLKKRVVTDFFVIDRTNVDTPEAQAVIYKG
jgi:ribose transport system substrate-binding protein